MKYELLLKNDKERSYRVISLLLLIINCISILYLTYANGFTKWGPLILALLAAFSVFTVYFFRNKNEKISFGVAFFFFALAWETAGYWPAAIINLFFSVANLVALKKPIVRISEEKILYPSIFRNTIAWKELSNLVLKDNLLTIDFKNNHLIQQMLDEKNPVPDEKEFNDFCKFCIEASSKSADVT